MTLVVRIFDSLGLLTLFIGLSLMIKGKNRNQIMYYSIHVTYDLAERSIFNLIVTFVRVFCVIFHFSRPLIKIDD